MSQNSICKTNWPKRPKELTQTGRICRIGSLSHKREATEAIFKNLAVVTGSVWRAGGQLENLGKNGEMWHGKGTSNSTNDWLCREILDTTVGNEQWNQFGSRPCWVGKPSLVDVATIKPQPKFRRGREGYTKERKKVLGKRVQPGNYDVRPAELLFCLSSSLIIEILFYHAGNEQFSLART